MQTNYDIIVVGAGHAGSEAAAAAANLGSRTLLITMDLTKIAQMSCNPAMGGIAKGQIVREIDALGGYSGIITDKSTIQFRMLNKSKGPAMWSPRSQNDRMLFSQEWRQALENTPNLSFWQDMVTGLFIDKQSNSVEGVQTKMGMSFYAPAVILTNGTFLNGLMHVGKNQTKGGRVSEPASYGLTEQIQSLGFRQGRMKTGTPPRIDGRTVNFEKMEEQPGDADPQKFSFIPEIRPVEKQHSCYITFTDPAVHETLRNNIQTSPLFNGTISSTGPRYCPSIEDKIVTFADKEKHQLFLEPEGINTVEYYLNGFSSSLSIKTQIEAIAKIPGLENARIFRPGYAIEYDYFDPTQLTHTLETKNVKNLFFAGQINGTTGYEEAGAQGIIAGINAHQKVHKGEAFYVERDEGYIGVLIDDLVTKGVDEPYRMFTSRAEYRILLRQDNADQRLTEKAYQIGLSGAYRHQIYREKQEAIEALKKFIVRQSVSPEQINPILQKHDSSPIKQKVKLEKILLRPEVSIYDLAAHLPGLKKNIENMPGVRNEILEQVEIQIKYDGYIKRERQVAEKTKRLETIKLHENFDYSRLTSISTEARQKLQTIKPKTIGQASRISGVSPADINVLLVFFGR